jgi:hypothetical protein
MGTCRGAQYVKVGDGIIIIIIIKIIIIISGLLSCGILHHVFENISANVSEEIFASLFRVEGSNSRNGGILV